MRANYKLWLKFTYALNNLEECYPILNLVRGKKPKSWMKLDIYGPNFFYKGFIKISRCCVFFNIHPKAFEFYNAFFSLCLSLKCVHVVIILFCNFFMLLVNCQQIYISNTLIFVIKLKFNKKENWRTTFSSCYPLKNSDVF